MKKAVVTGICGIIAAIVTGIFSYNSGVNKTEQKMENKIQQVVNIDGVGEEGGLDYVLERYEKLEKDTIPELQKKIEELEKKIDSQPKAQDTEKTSQENSQEIQNSTGDGKDMLVVCPPYEVMNQYQYVTGKSFKMCGETYNKGFTYGSPGPLENYYLLFNLDGKYSSMEFDLGHVDDTLMKDATIAVYLDGNVTQTIEKAADSLVSHEVIQLDGAKQLKLCFVTGGSGYYGNYGLANIKIYE